MQQLHLMKVKSDNLIGLTSPLKTEVQTRRRGPSNIMIENQKSGTSTPKFNPESDAETSSKVAPTEVVKPEVINKIKALIS